MNVQMNSANKTFHYETAFARNLGWITPQEQQVLRSSCVAIAGLGGAGGFQIQALARLGVGAFKIADADSFEMTNMNRQLGAMMETLGRSKADVLRDMILSINPEASVTVFKEPIRQDNVSSFLEHAAMAVDGIDFFEQKAKLIFFRACREAGIPATTCCPLGFGASVLTFAPGGMPYEEYFDLRDSMDEEAMRLAVAFGLSPKYFCLQYMNPEAFQPEKRLAGSVSAGLMLVGCITATEAVKILTGKYPYLKCPSIFQVDLLTHQVARKTFRFGMKSPWMRLKKKAAMAFMKMKGKK